MNRVIGYAVAVVGLVLMVFSFGLLGEVDLLGVDFGSVYVGGVGVVLVVVGVLISLIGGGGRVGKDKGMSEVPIYEGVGKKRRIVGYRKD